MKNKLSLFLFIVITGTIIYSCNDFIAVDLSKSSVTIIAPGDNVTSSSSTQLFKWDDVKGAEQYQLQIAKPSFTSITQFILDTTIKTTQYSYALQPGTYQWRVRAKNNSSSTDYITYNLKVDSSLNLSNEAVQLSTPVNDHYSNTLTNTFTWQTLPNADYYTFRISINGSPVFSKDTTATSKSYKFSQEGVYKWNVVAYNNSSNSTSSGNNIYTITIDTTKPVAPTPTYLPLNDTTSKNPVPLAWSSAETNTGTTFQVVISTDSTFTNNTKIVKDTTISILFYKFYNPVTALHYFWRVRAIDAATNIGAYSIYKRFIKP